MKILQVCKKIPYPPKDGEAIAIATITSGLHEAGHEVSVLAINTPKHHFDVTQLPAAIKKTAHFDTVFVDTSLSPIAAFLNLFTNKSYNIERFVSQAFKEKLVQYLQATPFDIVHLEGVYLAPYIATIRQHSHAPIIMRAHNVEFEIWERLAEEQKNPLKKIYMQLLAKRMKNFEVNSLQNYDGLVPISVKDEAWFKALGYQGKSLTIPASVDLNRYPSNYTTTEFPSIYFIGSLDWMPNQKGLVWFLDEVWPNLHQQFPKLKIYIAGRNIPQWFAEQNRPNVEIVGEVDNAITFMQSKAIMIVPLFSGSGMRIKIIEAMALGKPIVATSLAAEGIAYESGKDLMIANDAKTYVAHLAKLVQEKNFCTTLGNNARNFIANNHENKVLINRLVDFYNAAIAKRVNKIKPKPPRENS